jgi:O-antigen/teichoic acid export membrane protein
LGPYVIAVQLTELFSALPIALMISLFPALALSARDEKRFTGYLSESYRFLLLIAFAACALVTPVATPLILTFYGAQYLPTAGLLIVLIWSEVPVFFGVVLSNALVAKGIQKFTAYGAVAGAIANLLLNLVLIPRYGAMGASWATIVSYTIAGMAFPMLIREVRPVIWLGLKIALRPFLLALAIEAGLHYLPIAIPWKLLLATLAFTGGSLLTGAVGRRDVERLLEMARLRRSLTEPGGA